MKARTVFLLIVMLSAATLLNAENREEASTKLIITADGEWYINWYPDEDSGPSGITNLKINEFGYTFEWDSKRHWYELEVYPDTPDYFILNR
jgi:hypothetical protein